MADVQNFRSAFNGFNREDVVHYIEYINNKHIAQVGQLKEELQAMQSQLDLLRALPSQDSGLARQLEESKAKCAALEQELAEARANLAQSSAPAPAPSKTDEELEAYRRAERTERLAQERAAQLAAQANGILADATVKVDDAAARLSGMADQVAAQMSTLQAAVVSSKSVLQEAAASLSALQPVCPE